MTYSDELKDLVKQLDESVKRTQAKVDILKKIIEDVNRQECIDLLEDIKNSSDWDQYDLNNIKDIK